MRPVAEWETYGRRSGGVGRPAPSAAIRAERGAERRGRETRAERGGVGRPAPSARDAARRSAPPQLTLICNRCEFDGRRSPRDQPAEQQAADEARRHCNPE
jgi:hypothetical protein